MRRRARTAWLSLNDLRVPLRWMRSKAHVRRKCYKKAFTRQCLYVDPAGTTYERHKHSFRKTPWSSTASKSS